MPKEQKKIFTIWNKLTEKLVLIWLKYLLLLENLSEGGRNMQKLSARQHSLKRVRKGFKSDAVL